MGKDYSALYMSLALHLGAAVMLIISLPILQKAPPAFVPSPPISIEFIIAPEETGISVEDVEDLEAIEPEAVKAFMKPDVKDVANVAAEKMTSSPVPQSVEQQETNRLNVEFTNSYFVDAKGNVVSMADWVRQGLSKNKFNLDTAAFLSLDQIARALAASKTISNPNPLLGNGDLTLATPDVTSIKGKPRDSTAEWTSLTQRQRRNKEGAYTGGIYGSVGPSDANSAGGGVIKYEANISNCAHEEARTGVNRCRAFERWIAQKVYQSLKAQEKNKP